MSRTIGAVSRGIRTPIIVEGDNLVDITVQSLLEAFEEENITVNDRDIVGVTEAVVARAQGNYITCDHIAKDVANKLYSHSFPATVSPSFSKVSLVAQRKSCLCSAILPTKWATILYPLTSLTKKV